MTGVFADNERCACRDKNPYQNLAKKQSPKRLASGKGTLSAAKGCQRKAKATNYHLDITLRSPRSGSGLLSNTSSFRAI
jgi:hypothetical protein